MIKIVLNFVIVFSFQSFVAQTFEIAHKGHSGGPLELHTNGADLFGLSCPPLSRVLRIENENDTATVMYYGFEKKIYDQYRIEHHPIFNNPSLDMDSVMKTYPEEVEFVGFEKKTEKKEEKQEGLMPFYIPKGGSALLLLLLLIISVVLEQVSLSVKGNRLASN